MNDIPDGKTDELKRIEENEDEEINILRTGVNGVRKVFLHAKDKTTTSSRVKNLHSGEYLRVVMENYGKKDGCLYNI
ncbi:hypothetical protein [Sporosarcina limicola]|uniref:Uncharacterized protein n=1 Tax=Sporosarcina limicola TaxID=34101 RepID=A0A927R8N1_9BACL|nr:hypothetical protein [Sporosarcina limicola]MBE1557174.1 hypothetical protein [Sporosarcina limicola]